MCAAASSAGSDSPAALALQATRSGQWDQAAAIVARLVHEVFSLRTESVQISHDGYSFNSVNGFVQLENGEQYFFKFHHEEGEEVTLQELYRGELLRGWGGSPASRSICRSTARSRSDDNCCCTVAATIRASSKYAPAWTSGRRTRPSARSRHRWIWMS